MEKITKREMFNAMYALLDEGEMTFERDGEYFEVSEEEAKEFLSHEIELLDKKAEKAKDYAKKKKSEADELTNEVRNLLNEDEYRTINEIVKDLDNEEVSNSKVSARLKKLIDADLVEKESISVPGLDGGKSRKLMGYRLKASSNKE